MAAKLECMLEKFGSVTVMDVEVFEPAYDVDGEWDASATLGSGGTRLAKLDTLKITNINQEGPTKTITGGMNADILVKYGKTFMVEMQDALGQYDVLTNIYGAIPHGEGIISFSDRFSGPKTFVGTTFFIDQKTGAKQPVKIVMPLLLADSIFNLTGDAEGDASTFDINGNLIAFYKGAAGEIVGCKYASGGDNEFYFIATPVAYEAMVAGGYPDPFSLPSTITVEVGGTVQLTTGQTAIPGTTWESTATGTATVVGGLVTGVAEGTTTVSATATVAGTPTTVSTTVTVIVIEP